MCHSRALLTGDPGLRASALLCLVKLMAVDGAFCSAHLQLLFTLLQNRWASWCWGDGGVFPWGKEGQRKGGPLEYERGASGESEEGDCMSSRCWPETWREGAWWSFPIAPSVSHWARTMPSLPPTTTIANFPDSTPRRGVEPGLRSTLAVALGDLALRFPNMLEGWTERMYRPLQDADTMVGSIAVGDFVQG